MSIMLPAVATTNPAPADSEASEMVRVQSLGAPISLASSLKEYCVLAMHTGRWP